ncbi:MAG: hypothetical protein ACLT8E_12595 [Akkermansia sp.]
MRYRVIEPKKTDNGRAVWTAVREIAVNTPPSAMAPPTWLGWRAFPCRNPTKSCESTA